MFGELVGMKFIFCVWVVDGLIGDGIFGILDWIGMKIVDLFVGDGGGEGYGI